MSAIDELYHPPLPYVVVLRGTTGPDMAPQHWEQKVTAYSVLEAVQQAMFEIGGTMSTADAAKLKLSVERIGPDVPGYFAIAAARTKALLSGKS